MVLTYNTYQVAKDSDVRLWIKNVAEVQTIAETKV